MKTILITTLIIIAPIISFAGKIGSKPAQSLITVVSAGGAGYLFTDILQISMWIISTVVGLITIYKFLKTEIKTRRNE